MKVVKKTAKWFIIIILIPILLLLVSLILTYIPINKEQNTSDKNRSIYLNTNGIHLNIVIHKKELSAKLLDGLISSEHENYFSFGWGDKNFYPHTPTWSDLTFANAFTTLFLKSQSLIHLTRFVSLLSNWVEIKVNQHQINKINSYISKTFQYNTEGKKVLLKNKGYTPYDDFYEAVGNYTFFNTCNTWINSALKESNIKSCLWTPYEFGLIRLHK